LAKLRVILLAVVLTVFVLLAATFAYDNPQPIDVDIGVARLQGVSMAVTFVVVFACGWAFGVLSAALSLVRSANERRRLRKDLRYVEAELATLRSTAIATASSRRGSAPTTFADSTWC
jgi:uncharacterized membrane protein YciS (DUF1049 family)